MTDYNTLSTLTALAVENDVDIEIWHGETTHQDKRTRAHMLICPTDSPKVLVSFGDRKHGQRISRIALAGNDAIQVKEADLIQVMAENTTAKRWVRGIKQYTPMSQVLPFENGQVWVQGYVEPEGTLVDGMYEYVFVVRNFYGVPTEDGLKDVREAEPTNFKVRFPEMLRNVPSSTFAITGKYEYPGRIVVSEMPAFSKGW